jgi:cytochrome c553
MRIFLTAILLILVGQYGPAHAAGDPAAGKIKAYTCGGCHGIPGYKNTYPNYKVPKLGGQNAAYISAALNAYKSGERNHGTMNLQAESLSGQDIEDISAWFSSQGPSEVDVTMESGPGREKSTPCQACHGETGSAVDEALYPNLGGQHASYLEHALRGYRDGDRANALMNPFVAGLSDQDITDLAEWFAGQGGLRTTTPE